MNFNEINPSEYDKFTFGHCVRARREELGRSVRDVAKAINLSPIYLSDIERGLRVAPTGRISGINYMEEMMRELKIHSTERSAFLTMAEVTTGRFNDIYTYLSRTPAARAALRYAEECDIPEDMWLKFIDNITEQQEKSR